MSTPKSIEIALQEKNIQAAKKLIEQGYMITPHLAATLIEETEDCFGENIQKTRIELTELIIKVQDKKPVSIQELTTLPLNHTQNPMGDIEKIEVLFEKLLTEWEEEISE